MSFRYTSQTTRVEYKCHEWQVFNRYRRQSNFKKSLMMQYLKVLVQIYKHGNRTQTSLPKIHCMKTYSIKVPIKILQFYHAHQAGH